jgi:DNA repair protein RecO (recombination protein O)
MSQTYKATGIILKGQPFKESDRLVTVLTPEYGLISAVAPGAKKQKSRLRGRCELFVINEMSIVKGRSLDKIIQVETLESHPGLSKNLNKLAAGQYLAELVLGLALSEQPQVGLYELLKEHLKRIEILDDRENIFAPLSQAVFHLLAIAGIAPQVHSCNLSQKSLTANFTEMDWQVGFSFDSGGVIDLSVLNRDSYPYTTYNPKSNLISSKFSVREQSSSYNDSKVGFENNNQILPKIDERLNATELTLLQQLNLNSLPQIEQILPQQLEENSINLAWSKIEYLLRNYAQYHSGRLIRSANLVDNLSIAEY